MSTAFNEPKYDVAASAFRCQACTNEITTGTPYYSVVVDSENLFQRRDFCSGCWAQARASQGDEAARVSVGGEEVFAFWRTRRPAPTSVRPKRVRFDPDAVMQFFVRLGEEEEVFELPGVPAETPEESLEGLAAGADNVQGAQLDGDESEVTQDEQGSTSAEGSDVETVAEDSVGEVEEPDSPGTLGMSDKAELRFFLALLLIRRKFLTIKRSGYRDDTEWLRLAERGGKVHDVWNPQVSEDRLHGLKDRLGTLLQMRL